MIDFLSVNAAVVHTDVQQALEEDIGAGDITAELIPALQQAHAVILCREEAVICGRAWVDAAFKQVDNSINIVWRTAEGVLSQAGSTVCEIQGPARGIITAERTALNFLQTLSGTATRARRFKEAVAGLSVRLLDTRKTIPGLRSAQKYAVRCGGCENHRQGLFDAL
ncbi:MAG TPA: nicotinate-nucleotide diphosphorylase (carboxylating), partial [Gammaproteobacteria bacterium]